MVVMDIDDRHWPLVVQTFDGLNTDEDVESFLARKARIYERGAPFVTLTYIGAYAWNVAHVQRMGEAMKSEPQSRALCRGCAIIAPSPSFRFVISSFYLIARIPYPHVVCDDLASAESWLRQRLRESHLPIPEYLGLSSVRPSRAPIAS
jgi:hypothetical protein